MLQASREIADKLEETNLDTDTPNIGDQLVNKHKFTLLIDQWNYLSSYLLQLFVLQACYEITDKLKESNPDIDIPDIGDQLVGCCGLLR